MRWLIEKISRKSADVNAATDQPPFWRYGALELTILGALVDLVVIHHLIGQTSLGDLSLYPHVQLMRRIPGIKLT